MCCSHKSCSARHCEQFGVRHDNELLSFSENVIFRQTFSRKKSRLSQTNSSNLLVFNMNRDTKILNPEFNFCKLPENFTGQRKNECENKFFDHKKFKN